MNHTKLTDLFLTYMELADFRDTQLFSLWHSATTMFDPRDEYVAILKAMVGIKILEEENTVDEDWVKAYNSCLLVFNIRRLGAFKLPRFSPKRLRLQQDKIMAYQADCVESLYSKLHDKRWNNDN